MPYKNNILHNCYFSNISLNNHTCDQDFFIQIYIQIAEIKRGELGSYELNGLG